MPLNVNSNAERVAIYSSNNISSNNNNSSANNTGQRMKKNKNKFKWRVAYLPSAANLAIFLLRLAYSKVPLFSFIFNTISFFSAALRNSAVLYIIWLFFTHTFWQHCSKFHFALLSILVPSLSRSFSLPWKRLSLCVISIYKLLLLFVGARTHWVRAGQLMGVGRWCLLLSCLLSLEDMFYAQSFCLCCAAFQIHLSKRSCVIVCAM